MESVKRFAKVRADLLETVINFPEGKVEETVCGQWDIKCVLSHIAGWDIYLTMAVRLLRTGKDVPFRGGKVQEWNRAFVKEREGRTWSEVREEFARAGEEFLKEYISLEGDFWRRGFWSERNPTPAWVVKYSAEHCEEHLEEIRRKLREWEGRYQVEAYPEGADSWAKESLKPHG
jgi:hypothetical protein